MFDHLGRNQINKPNVHFVEVALQNVNKKQEAVASLQAPDGCPVRWPFKAVKWNLEEDAAETLQENQTFLL